jgi:hypothetical protein
LQTTLAADAHLAEGQFLNEEQTLNNADSMIYRAGTQRPIIIIIIIIIMKLSPLFMCWAQYPVANYRISTNTKQQQQ